MIRYVFLDQNNLRVDAKLFNDQDEAEAYRVEINAASFEIFSEHYATISQRRRERLRTFSLTVDRMNPVWYDSLSEDQKLRLRNWREQWLDYPLSGVSPTENVEDIF